eukprot:SAG11_NODE_3997_length_2115_cov_1.295139_2_plen_69_part_00
MHLMNACILWLSLSSCSRSRARDDDMTHDMHMHDDVQRSGAWPAGGMHCTFFCRHHSKAWKKGFRQRC